MDAMKQIMQGGGDYGQGFYFGKAMPAGEATKLVHAATDVNMRRKA